MENAIERAVVLAEAKPQIEVGDLPPEIQSATDTPSAEVDGPLSLAEAERRHIVATLESLDGNRKEAAKVLRIGETTLWRKLKGYGLVKSRRESVGK